jgi:predicted esterase
MLAALLLVLASQAEVTRADLAQAYTRFEKVYFAARLEPEKKRELNRAYDQACLAYFGGEQRKLLDELERLSVGLGAQAQPPAEKEPPYDWDGCRTTMLVALSRIESKGPALEQALATARARAALLRSHPSPDVLAEFQVERRKLATDLDAEIGALQRGDDPYRRRTGDLWRVVKLEKGELPLRLYAPAQAAKDAPLPLVIALHGARGDENMFLDGYGLGKIRALADKHGFLLACPRTGSELTPERLEALLRALALDYAIDEKRIALLGHSMGAGVAARLAGANPERFCALACFSGGPRASAERLPPTWMRVGAIDQLADPAGLEAAAKELHERGLAIDFQILPDLGHTLIVGEALDGAIDWLLGHRLPG